MPTHNFRNINQYTDNGIQVAEEHRQLVHTVLPHTTNGVYMIHLAFEDLPSKQSLKRRAPSPEHQCEAKPKRFRTYFQKDQLELLEKQYDINNFLEPHRRRELSKILNLSENCLKVWFQNRRRRDSKIAKQFVADRLSSIQSTGDIPTDVTSIDGQSKSITEKSTSIGQSVAAANLAIVKSTASDSRRDVPPTPDSGGEQPRLPNNFADLLDQLVVCLPDAIEMPRLKSKEEILQDLFEFDQNYTANKISPPAGINCKPSLIKTDSDPKEADGVNSLSPSIGFSIAPSYLSNHDSDHLRRDDVTEKDASTDLNLSFNISFLL